MILAAVILTVFLSTLVVVRPFFIEANNNSDVNIISERQDLERFLASLDFELERKLITEKEYARQKDQTTKRLAEISADLS